jgi:hypothetical protein
VTALLETRTKVLLDALDGAAGPVRGRKRTAGASAPAGDAFEAELAGFVSAVAAHFDANRFLLNVLLDEERSRGIDAKAASRRRTVFGQLLSRAERLMQKGIRVRALRKDDPAMYAALLVGMVRGVARERAEPADDVFHRRHGLDRPCLHERSGSMSSPALTATDPRGSRHRRRHRRPHRPGASR